MSVFLWNWIANISAAAVAVAIVLMILSCFLSLPLHGGSELLVVTTAGVTTPTASPSAASPPRPAARSRRSRTAAGSRRRVLAGSPDLFSEAFVEDGLAGGAGASGDGPKGDAMAEVLW